MLTLVGAGGACAQIVDDFSDGNLDENPPWVTGDTLWSVVPGGSDFVLRTNGRNESDTLFASTPNRVAVGTWRFVLGYEGGAPSNFNLARALLTADVPDLTGPVTGYYVQFGTNDRNIRLYRSDAGAPGNRILLASSADDVLAAAEDTLAVTVYRSEEFGWVVYVDGEVALTHEEDPATRDFRSAHFGFWIKHSASRARAFWLDDVYVSSALPPDTTAPRVLRVSSTGPRSLRVGFNEPLDPDGGCGDTYSYLVSPGARHPAEARCPDGAPSEVSLRFGTDIAPGEYQLSVGGVADTSGNVLRSQSFPFTSSFHADAPSPGEVVFNEIMYDPDDPELEFVELINRSGRTFDLSEFHFADGRDAPVAASAVTLPLRPGAFMVLARDEALLRAAFPSAHPIEVSPWPALNDGGDHIVLTHGDNVIDSLTYTTSWGIPGVSLERRDPRGPSWHPVNWRPAGDAAGATPGEENSVYEPDVKPPEIVFAEETRDGILVHFGEPVDVAGLEPVMFEVGGEVPTRVSPGSGAGVGGTVLLSVDDVAAVRADPTLRVAGVVDLTGNVAEIRTASVALLPGPGDLVVNEIMYDPRADPADGHIDQPEYVELFNTTNRLLTLTGLLWTNTPDESGAADTLHTRALAVGIEAGSFAVVFAEQGELPPDELYTASALVVAFPADYRALGTVLLPVRASTLGLGNTGELIRLSNGMPVAVDSVRYDPDWHHWHIETPKGLSLERLDPFAPSSDADNWTSSPAAAGGSPGRENAVTLPLKDPEPPAGIQVSPSPFSPDGDGLDDFAALDYSLRSSSSVVRARVFDAHGRLVRTLGESQPSGRLGRFIWDGLDEAGRPLRVGIYVVLVESLDVPNRRSEKHKAAVVLARPLD